MKKRLLSIAMVLLMCLTLLPAPVLAVNEGAEQPAADAEGYSTADIAAINAMIDNNGLNANKDDPDSWTFASWDWYQNPYRITKLRIYEKGLTGSLNMSGLVELTYLDCNNNQLTELNVSGLSKLKNLSCYSNQITSLDVSGLSALETLNCANNGMETLTLTGATALTELNCNTNSLKALDVSSLGSLKKLYCHKNQLETLNLTGATALADIACSDNLLTELGASNLPNLTELSCYRCKLQTLTVSGDANLTRLLCSDNQLTTLNLNGATKLSTLQMGNNAITNYTNSAGYTLTIGKANIGYATIHKINPPSGSSTYEVTLQAYKPEGPVEYWFDHWDINGQVGTSPDMPKLTENTTVIPVIKYRFMSDLIEDIPDQPYTGAEIHPVPEVSAGTGDEKITFEAGKDFTCSYEGDLTSVGTTTATVKITPTAGGALTPIFTPSRNFNIIKAVPTLTPPTAEAYYGQKLSDAVLSGGAAVNPGNSALAVKGVWSWADTETQVTEAGDYPAQFTPTDTNNYEIPDAASTSVTVNPTTPSITVTVPEKRAVGQTVAVSAVTANPYDPTLADAPTAKLTYQIGDAAAQEISGNSFIIPEGTATGTVITITAATESVEGKYTAGKQSAIITVSDKILPTGAPTLSTETITYGQPLSTITLSGSMMDGETPVPGTFTWSAPDICPHAQESYAAEWVFTPEDGITYASARGTSSIKVDPASLAGAEITLDKTSFRADGTTAHTPVPTVTLGNNMLVKDNDYTVSYADNVKAGTAKVTITGMGNYTGTASVTFQINHVNITDLPQQDDNGHALRLEVETGLSEVPDALQNKPEFNTPEKIEAALRTAVEKVMSNAGENIVVFDVRLQYKDDNGVWKDVDPDDFPADGVTAILSYPTGTGATDYTFTVQHLISSGRKAGTMETLPYTLTKDGLQCKFSSLSPVAIGYEKKSVIPDIPSYTVTVEKPEHGKVIASRVTAASGATVTLTVTPDSGYVLDTLRVTDSRGGELKLTAKGDGTYTFTMPNRAVTVQATFVPKGEDKPCDGGKNCPSRAFTDLNVKEWYHEAVDYALNESFMGGYGNSMFGPDDNLSRAQLAQILYNHAGRPAVSSTSRFTDVAKNAWYTKAIAWAGKNNILLGYGNGMFGPNDPTTREQLAVILWRYSGSPASAATLDSFTDGRKTDAWAVDALRWAVEKKIVSGKGNGILDPRGNATRAEVAAMLMRYCKTLG